MSRMVLNKLLIAWLAFGSVLAAKAGDFYVDPKDGDDRANGTQIKPVRSISKGLALVSPGDTLHFAPCEFPISESIEIQNRSGHVNAPITIDGHGAILTGLSPIDPSEWQSTGNGIFRNPKLWKKLRGNAALLERIFFCFEGRVERMGRFSKGPQPAFKKPKELKFREWTYVADEETFYVRVGPGQTLEKAAIEFPMRESGVRIRGTCSDFVIRNITTTHFWNDGFNIHNDCRRTRFENITAIENGDDGFSAHETCQLEVDGLKASGNSTGICNINQAECRFLNCALTDNLRHDFSGFEGTKFDIVNMSIESRTAVRPFVVMGNRKTGQQCTVKLDNVQIVRSKDLKGPIEVASHGNLIATRMTSIGLDWAVDGTVELRRSILVNDRFASQLKLPLINVVSDSNAFQFDRFQVGEKTWSKNDFKQFLTSIKDMSSQQVTLKSTDISSLIRGTRPADIDCGAVISEMQLPKSVKPTKSSSD